MFKIWNYVDFILETCIPAGTSGRCSAKVQIDIKRAIGKHYTANQVESCDHLQHLRYFQMHILNYTFYIPQACVLLLIFTVTQFIYHFTARRMIILVL